MASSRRAGFYNGVFPLLLLLTLAGPAGAADQRPPSGWRAGVARAVITPTEPLWLAGYAGRSRPAEGKRHDLWVKALALTDRVGYRAIVITADLLGMSRPMYERIQTNLVKRLRLDRSAILLACSHTHTGPVTSGLLESFYPLSGEQKQRVETYSRLVERRIVETAAAAFSRLEPATLWAGEGSAGFAVNRRNNPESEVPAILTAGGTLRGPVDHSVPVLAVKNTRGELLAVLFGYACHPTVLDDYRWSGDFPGYAQLSLERTYPDGAAMFWTGCGADQNPLPRRAVELSKKYGAQLADSVNNALKGEMRPLSPTLRTAAKVVPLKYDRTPTRQELEADANHRSGYRARWARMTLATLDSSNPSLPLEYPYRVQAWRLGNQLWIQLSGESVVDYSLRFKKEFGAGTWVAGFAHDTVAYIPSRRVWDEGGYEAEIFEYGHPAYRWAADIEERVAAGVRMVAADALQNRPIVTVSKELYKSHPRPGAAADVTVNYVGPKREREEIHSLQIRDDVPDEPKRRFSADGGRTWSEFEPQPTTLSYPKGVEVWEGPGAKLYDPKTGALVGVWLRQINRNGLYHNFTYSRISRDFGKTWSTPRQLKYESGDDFDPDNPLNPGFLQRNHAYFGSNILRYSNGTLIHAVAHANAEGDVNEKRPWRMASLCFVGRWDKNLRGYQWTAGKRIAISPEVSSRGLMEPEVAELADGRVLVIWRGSNTSTTPGRKWHSISADGGVTLSPVQELRYDDGSQFYSPSSFHRMIRHSITKRLYWIGNICPNPPSANSPRYPLVIAEIDESIPALKRDTVTVIDDRQPDQSPAVQFSNFSLVENRNTHELELYLTPYGEDASNVFTADNYKYTLRLAQGRRTDRK